ncbi:MAG: cell division protein FtsQ/DivIB [Thermodesulfobacteriota bacterium]
MSGKRSSNFDRKKRSSGQSWTRKTIFAIVIMVCGSSLLLGAVWILFKKGFEQSIFFKIDKVDIRGCSYLSPRKVLALTGLDVKSGMWEIETDKLTEKLEQQNWIEEAQIDKDWPSQIRITIKERFPQALMSRQGELFYVDSKGIVFAPVFPDNDIDFPVITVDKAINREFSWEKDIYLALQFLQRAARGNPDLPKQNISEIHCSDTGYIMFLVDYPFPIYLGQKGDMSQKYRKLSRVLSWLYSRQKIGETEYIDMNYLTVDEEDREEHDKDVMVVFKES